MNALSCPKLFALFVDGVVREVHEEVIEVVLITFGIEWLEFLCSKSNETLLVQKNLQWLATEDKNVQAKVKLKTVQ